MNVVICGCPRSGTTALVDYLNADSRVFVTHELCNFIWEEPL
ncbi:sulfotransferase, partial [Escherichia coli]